MSLFRLSEHSAIYGDWPPRGVGRINLYFVRLVELASLLTAANEYTHHLCPANEWLISSPRLSQKLSSRAIVTTLAWRITHLPLADFILTFSTECPSA